MFNKEEFDKLMAYPADESDIKHDFQRWIVHKFLTIIDNLSFLDTSRRKVEEKWRDGRVQGERCGGQSPAQCVTAILTGVWRRILHGDLWRRVWVCLATCSQTMRYQRTMSVYCMDMVRWAANDCFSCVLLNLPFCWGPHSICRGCWNSWGTLQ